VKVEKSEGNEVKEKRGKVSETKVSISRYSSAVKCSKLQGSKGTAVVNGREKLRIHTEQAKRVCVVFCTRTLL